MIMTAAYIVSRASAALSSPPASIIDTISADLDDRHGEREHQRAERLADAMRDDLGVVHRGEHGDQRDAAGDPEQRADGSLQRRGEQPDGEQRHDYGPAGHERLSPVSVAHLYYRTPPRTMDP